MDGCEKTAGNRYALWLKSGRIGGREGAILGESALVRQISNTSGLDGVVNLFYYLLEW